MIVWNDCSDRKSRFFEGQDSDKLALGIEEAVEAAIAFAGSELIGNNNAVEFDLLMTEVNCDTGRLIIGVSTEQRHSRGETDGCCVVVTELQDFWYGLIDQGLSPDHFASAVATKVIEVGRLVEEKIRANLKTFRSRSSKHGFEFVLYGSDPGRRYVSEHYE